MSSISSGTTTTTGLVYTSDTTGNLLLQTGSTPTTAVTIDTSQNVGVGVIPSAWGGSFKAVELPFGSFAGYSTTEMDITQNSYQNGINYLYKTTNYASLNRQASGAHYWFTAPSGTAGNAITFTQAMTLDASGNLLIGTTSLGTTNAYFQNSTNARTVLSIGSNTTSSVGLIYFNNPNGGVGTISTSGTATAYNTSSDSRLKTLIGVATDASLIDDIVVNDFTWKVDGTNDRGVFAQDAQKIKPTAIHPGETEELNESGLPIHPWGVDYSKFVPDLIVYCQQLKKQVTELSAKVTALEAKVA